MSCDAAVAIVMVTYQPHRSSLLENLRQAMLQAGQVFLVDNGSDAAALQGIDELPGLRVERLGNNVGIAAAQNLGVSLARKLGYEWILFLDQDSCLHAGCVPALKSAYLHLENNGIPVAAVGAAYFNDTLKRSGAFVRLKGIWLQQHCPEINGPPLKVDYLISSGMMIRVGSVEQVGEFEEALFIDWVDTEWCIRSRSKGWGLFGVPSAQLSHSLGSDALRIAGLKVPLHGPGRHYFVYRNFVAICKRNYVPNTEKVALMIRMSLRLVLYLLFANQRRCRLLAILRGIRDGWQGKLGKAEYGKKL